MDGFTGRFEHCGFSSLAGLSATHRRVLHCPMACADKRSRGDRPPRLKLGTLPGKASSDLDGGATSVDLRDNWSRNEQNEISRAPRTGMFVSSLGPTSPTPVHTAASTNEAQTC